VEQDAREGWPAVGRYGRSLDNIGALDLGQELNDKIIKYEAVFVRQPSQGDHRREQDKMDQGLKLFLGFKNDVKE